MAILVVESTVAISDSSKFELPSAAAPFDTRRIEMITGLKGNYNPAETTFRASKARSDVSIEVDGDTLPSFFTLTTWAAFKPGKRSPLMMMGDFVVFPDEANAVMSILLESGIDVTALHNHFMYDEPHVFFMHFSGEGDLERLASVVRRGLDKIVEIRKFNPQPAKSFGNKALPPQSSISPQPLEMILGKAGVKKEGTLKVIWGGTTSMPCGCTVGSDMGVNTFAAFAGSDTNGVVFGDYFVHENELTPVLKSLRRSGIFIVAIHSHMSGENPRILYLHYWGRGPASELAQAVKRALDVQNSQPQRSHLKCQLTHTSQ